jgi:UDP-N-acetylmuramoylalanine--D-glutamate ligase
VGFVGDVRVVNDSKSTNAASAIAAIRAVQAPAVVLIGGRSKGAGYEALADELEQSDVRSVVLFGEAAPALEGIFAQRSLLCPRIINVRCLNDAIDRGLEVCEPGDVLLFSPACSSFDAFTDYVERGTAFSARIRSRPRFREDATRT